MTDTISRRGLLQAATVAGITTMANGLPSWSAPAQNAGRPAGNSDERAVPIVSLAPGLQLYYREDWLGEPWRKPEVALLIHGNLESGIVWYGWVPRMASKFRLLRPDLPGYGNSTVPSGFEWSMPNIATVLANFLDKMGVESAHIIGAKTGGAIAIQFAASYPQRTRTLVLASAPATADANTILYPNLLTNQEKSRFLAEHSPQSQANRLGPAASREQIAFFNQMEAATIPEPCFSVQKMLRAAQINKVMEDCLPRITSPTLVITTDRSSLQSVETVLHYQQKIPKSRLLVIASESYHVVVTNSDECISNVLAFIEEARKHG